MSPSNSVLILGSSGLLGSHLLAVLRELDIPFVQMHPKVKFCDGFSLLNFLEHVQPKAVVNCIGYKGEDAARHLEINAWFPRVIAGWCDKAGVLSVQVSTNAVFAPHESRTWLPGDHLAPSTDYEIAKALGEDTRSYVVRASFIGASPKKEGLFDKLRQGCPVADRQWNGVTALRLARRIVSIVEESDARARFGIEHVHSSSPISFRDVAEGLGSSSRILDRRCDARLLGGGLSSREFTEDLDDYLRWVSEADRRARMGMD